jgi:N-acetylneuraminate synthase
MSRWIRFGNRKIGEGYPVYITAEIGINHNGDLGMAKKLIETAKSSGCDAVKFQKRKPDLCVPSDQRHVMRETPWGLMSYLEYRRRIELGKREYKEIVRYCKKMKIDFLVSCWDEESVEFMEPLDPVCYKIASATLPHDSLLRLINSKRRPMVLSTGMSTMSQIRHAVSLLDRKRLILSHCTSVYPCEPSELNLRMITTLRKVFPCPVGYSGHEVGLQTTYAAAALGACYIERHITLDRAMWGSDQALSVGPSGFVRLVRDIRVIESAMGDGKKKIYPSELPLMKRLRRA